LITQQLSNPGKVCLITGANSGVGKAAALALAGMGATVVLLCRDAERGKAAQADVAAAATGSAPQLVLADLSSQQEIRGVAEAIQQRISRLDVLVNNAGAFFAKRSTTVDGLECTFAINHLAYFLLSDLLLDLLKRSAPARIINLSSGSHVQAHLDFEDLQSEHNYNGWRAYGRSKLANVLFTYALARRLTGSGVTVNAVHPGVVKTNFGRSSGFLRFGMRAAGTFLLSPEEGADTVVYLATSPDVADVTGRYFVKRKPIRSSPESRDQDVQERLWQVSEQLTGPD
jgi:NAD(P)-dependent dehydrogenase (short-subunit alcohol dehydrogenase family)